MVTNIGLMILQIVLVPLIILFSINTLAENAGINFYILHNIWTYSSVWGILIFSGKIVDIEKKS